MTIGPILFIPDGMQLPKMSSVYSRLVLNIALFCAGVCNFLAPWASADAPAIPAGTGSPAAAQAAAQESVADLRVKKVIVPLPARVPATAGTLEVVAAACNPLVADIEGLHALMLLTSPWPPGPGRNSLLHTIPLLAAPWLPGQ